MAADYIYRIGEVRDLTAKIVATSDKQPVTITSAALRLLSKDGKQIWQRAGSVSAQGLIKYQMTDVKIKGDYKMQWVYVVAGQTRYSDVFTLQVKGASDV